LTENDEKKSGEERSGVGGGAGESVRPSAEVEPGAGREGREIPIGIPMDPEEFRRRKAQAEQPSREAQGQADEDASTTQQGD
jgi:hypothetical protein